MQVHVVLDLGLNWASMPSNFRAFFRQDSARGVRLPRNVSVATALDGSANETSASRFSPLGELELMNDDEGAPNSRPIRLTDTGNARWFPLHDEGKRRLSRSTAFSCRSLARNASPGHSHPSSRVRGSDACAVPPRGITPRAVRRTGAMVT